MLIKFFRKNKQIKTKYNGLAKSRHVHDDE
jgi:hypothetical protein